MPCIQLPPHVMYHHLFAVAVKGSLKTTGTATHCLLPLYAFTNPLPNCFIGNQPKSTPAWWRWSWGDWSGDCEPRCLYETPPPKQVRVCNWKCIWGCQFNQRWHSNTLICTDLRYEFMWPSGHNKYLKFSYCKPTVTITKQSFYY